MLALAVAVHMIIAALNRKKARREGGGSDNKAWPYTQRVILTPPEQTFFHRLKEAVPGFPILAQVGLSRVIETPGKTPNRWFAQISQKSVDFLICTHDFQTLAVIELDDSSHNTKSRQKADAVKTKALNDAGIHLIRWTVKNMPDAATIRAHILKNAPQQRD